MRRLRPFDRKSHYLWTVWTVWNKGMRMYWWYESVNAGLSEDIGVCI